MRWLLAIFGPYLFHVLYLVGKKGAWTAIFWGMDFELVGLDFLIHERTNR